MRVAQDRKNFENRVADQSGVYVSFVSCRFEHMNARLATDFHDALVENLNKRIENPESRAEAKSTRRQISLFDMRDSLDDDKNQSLFKKVKTILKSEG